MSTLDDKADIGAGSCTLSSTSSCRLGVNHLHPEIVRCMIAEVEHEQKYERKT
jgi:hypothetical protein